MNTIIKLALVAVLAFFAQNVRAQETDDTIEREGAFEYETEMNHLKKEKDLIYEEERRKLKAQVISIEKRKEKGEITADEAETLKREAAQKTALNIDNKIAIIDNEIALLERNKTSEYFTRDRDGSVIKFGDVFTLGTKNYHKKRPIKFDRRTYSDFVLAFGLNNALIEGENLNDSPYRIGGSRFAELGIAWKTRVFKNTGWLRIKYGFSFQFNGLKPEGNRVFVNGENGIALEEFELDLDKSKFRVDNLVLPFHFEIGPYKKRTGENYVRYYSGRKFKIGLGGYAGINIGARQKLIFKRNGNRVKEKQKRGFETNNFVYGLSGYVAIEGIAVYAKYDLNPIFKNGPEQRNISLGLRFDMD